MTFKQKYHIVVGEFYGDLAAKSLVKLGKHALAINDITTFDRALSCLEHGVNVGFDDTIDAKLTPNRSKVTPIILKGGVCHICNKPNDEAGEIWCSGAHPR